MLRRITPLALIILSAVLLSLSFSSFNLGVLAWVGLVPLFLALENKSFWQSWRWAYFCGLIFWSATIYWLIHVTFLGLVILILYSAIYFGIFGLAFYFFRRAVLVQQLLFLPCVWVGLEYARSYLFTGFPWALLGFSQYKFLPIIQIAAFTGVWGVSFLVSFVNLLVYLIIRRNLKFKSGLCSALVLIFVFSYGIYVLNFKPLVSAATPKVKVTVIQGDIPQELKWDHFAQNFILRNYQELILACAKERADLIIFPEASMPWFWGTETQKFKPIFSLAQELKTTFLVGTVSDLGEQYFNSALLISGLKLPLEIYHKLHLVPFGEYIPFKKTFPFLETIVPIGDIQAGTNPVVFTHPVKFSVLICFEDLFPELSRKFVAGGAKFLVNITNDAWYKQGSAPYQHFAASVFRAVENRVYLARSANTGISGFIDPRGRVLALVKDAKNQEIFIKGFQSQDIFLVSEPPTFYNRYGDWLIILCFLYSFSVILYYLRSNKG